jgi:hypothetical protein
MQTGKQQTSIVHRSLKGEESKGGCVELTTDDEFHRTVAQRH